MTFDEWYAENQLTTCVYNGEEVIAKAAWEYKESLNMVGEPKATTCGCSGWGCGNCCSSPAEIRMRQGIPS